MYKFVLRCFIIINCLLFQNNGCRILHCILSICFAIHSYGLGFYSIRFVLLYWIFFEVVFDRYIFPWEFRLQFFQEGRDIIYEIREEIKRLENPNDDNEYWNEF